MMTQMATLRVRYRNGDTDEWKLHERMDLQMLGSKIAKVWPGNHVIALGVAPDLETDTGPDYAMVWLRLTDLVMLEINGYVDDEFLASVWDLS